MGRSVIEINGQAPFVNYGNIKDSFQQESIARFCENATVYLLNKFPLTSTDAPIDLLFVLAVKNEDGNYITFRRNGTTVYLKNIIVPIRCIDIYEEGNFSVDGNFLSIDDNEIPLWDDINSLKFGLMHFLVQDCSFEKNSLFLFPLIFFKSSKTRIVSDDFIVDKEINWDNIFSFIQRQNKKYAFVSSYKNWNDASGYDILFPEEMKKCIEVAANLSLDNGYLTKKKLDLLTKNLNKDLEVYEHIGKRLVLITGKAGTGKTNQLMNLMLYLLSKGRNAKYITYNNLLVFDIAKLVNSFLNNQNRRDFYSSASVMSIHKFFFRLSRQLGVLAVMSERRATELINTLKERIENVHLLSISLGIDAQKLPNLSHVDSEALKELFSNANVEKAIKELGINFTNFAYKRRGKHTSFTALKEDFVAYQSELVRNQISQQVFRVDYYEVLKNVIRVLNDADSYYNDNSLDGKIDLLSGLFNLKDIKELSLKLYAEKVNRKIGGFRHGYYLFIDEAQDCHPLERDILIKIFGGSKITCVNGGTEQLIRHVELCRWERFDGKAISHFLVETGKKSLRLKKNLLELCMYVGKTYHVELELTPLKSDDSGKIIMDFRAPFNRDYYNQPLEELLKCGIANGCSPYESLLVMLNTSALGYGGELRTTITVNEFDNIEEHVERDNLVWNGAASIATHYPIWDGTSGEKARQDVPYHSEVRIIHFESCRGLEAWTTACVDVDAFFRRKVGDEDAERFLIGTTLPLEERKRTYAATWLLMALTRAIDTIYLKFESKDSELGKLLYEYGKAQSDYCTILE